MEEMEYIPLHSEETNELNAALAAFQGQVTQPTFNKCVNYGNTKFAYADLAECQRVARKALSDNGLSLNHTMNDDVFIAELKHKSGQFMRWTMKIVIPHKMQEFGSMLTYLKRYSFCALLGIAGEADDDANIVDNTGKVPEQIVRPAPKPSITDSKPTPKSRAKKADEAIAEATRAMTLDADIKQAIAAVKACETIEQIKQVYNSCDEAILNSPMFLGACTERKNYLKDQQSKA